MQRLQSMVCYASLRLSYRGLSRHRKGDVIAGDPSATPPPESPQALAAAGRWHDALRAANSSGAGAPDWLLAAAARALAAPTATQPDDKGPGPALDPVPEGAGAPARDALRPRGAERLSGAEGRQGADSDLGLASGPGAADSTPLKAGDTAAGTDTAAQGWFAGPGPAAGPGARARSGNGEASVSAASSARRGRRLAWECCMRLRDKRLAAEVALECLGAGAAVEGVVGCHA